MKAVNTHFAPSAIDSQRGLSLVELMVAVAISLLLLAGVLQIFIGSRQTYTVQDGMARLQENARYALDRISQDISRTGYLGCSDSKNVTVVNNLMIQSPAYDYAAAIFGQDNTGVGNTDILTLRYGSSGGIRITARANDVQTGENILQLDTTNPNYNQLQQFDILTLSDCDAVSVFMITNDPASSGGTIEHAAGVVASNGPNAGQSNSSAQIGNSFFTENASTATTFRTSSTTYLVGASYGSSGGNALFVNSIAQDNELIQGVEDFQVLYGVNDDTTLGADRYVTANNVTSGGTDWNDVVSVRITLRLNTVDPVQAGNTIAKTFTKTVRLRNRGDTI